MSDQWQPAIVHHTHAKEARDRNMLKAPSYEQELAENGTKVLVRPLEGLSPFCGGKIYELHPNVPKISISHVVCEHEILTD